ncbi:MAG: tRNA-dependent cyclodipeptide synthase [Campylobacterota bacterium]|nr:tRNA-dependent cyclodipeptide synthase [Campylobacterota bacterium]
MTIIDLYNSRINDKEMSLSVSQYHSEINKSEMFNAKEFAFIGISLGNSYFSEERLELIFKAFSSNFKRVAVLLVDELSVHNYRVLGYDEKKTKKKLKANANRAINRMSRAMEKTNTLHQKNNIEFYRWSDVEQFDTYHDVLKKITHLYETNSEFKDTIVQITKDVIEKYLHEQFCDAFLDESKWYFLKEIAFGCCINEFFNEDKVLNCYYQDFKFYREFFETNYMKIDNSKKQDFIIYHCSE